MVNQEVLNKVLKKINHFPPVYRKQAMDALDLVIENTETETMMAFAGAFVMYLAEEEHYGEIRLKRARDYVQKKVDEFSDRYEGAVGEGFIKRLGDMGIQLGAEDVYRNRA